MSRLLIFGLVLSFGAVGAFVTKKINQVKGLALLKLLPAKDILTFKRITNKIIEANVNLVIDNPTGFAYYLKNFNAVLHVESKMVNMAALQVSEIKIFPNASNLIFVPATIQVDELLDLAKNILFGSSANVQITGTIIYVTSSVEVPYPFSFEVNLKDQLNQFLKSQT